jgi:hypothetical protein
MFICKNGLRGMGRFTIIVDDELDTEFRIAAVKKRIRLNKAFEEAMKLWLDKFQN